MKKNIIHILIVLLIISNVISFFKINQLENQIDIANAEMNHLDDNIRQNTYLVQSLEEMIKQNSSLIESGTTEMGVINKDEITVPITFTLTPKEVSENTAIDLDFDGDLFNMEKNDKVFSTTVSRNIFDNAVPKIVIHENGSKKITEDDRIGIWNMRENILPTLTPSFDEGTMMYSDDVFQRKGKFRADLKEVESGVKFTDVHFEIEVDDQVVRNESIPYNELINDGFEWEEETAIDDGQVYTMKVIALNSLGLEHHYIVGHWTLDTSDPYENPFNEEAFREKQYSFELIYSAEGELLSGINYK